MRFLPFRFIFILRQWGQVCFMFIVDYIIQLFPLLFQHTFCNTIRELPGVVGSLIALGVIAVGAAIAAGVAMYKQKKAAEKMQDELDKMKKLSNRESIDNRPFLRGANNAKATGNSQPYVIGRHLFTPYTLSDPFYQLAGSDGETQYVYHIFELGFAPQVIKSVSIDDIKIKSFSSSSAQNGAFQMDSSIFSEDGLLEIRQKQRFQTLSALNYKHISKTLNSEIVSQADINDGKKSPFVFSVNEHAKNVEIAFNFPNGLYYMNDDGDKKSHTVSVKLYISYDGGKSFSYLSEQSISKNESAKELRYVFSHSFTLTDYRRLKQNGQSQFAFKLVKDYSKKDNEQTTCYLMYWQCLCFDPAKSSSPAGVLDDNGEAGLVSCLAVEDRELQYCALLALRVKANASNEEKLTKVNVITQGMARVWNSKSRKWSESKTETRNPAAWALEIETSETHPASHYADDELDLESFGEWYEHCEANGFFADWVITQNQKKDAVLQYLLDSTGAALYYDLAGRRAVALDRVQENAVAVYNAHNIISAENKRSIVRKTDGYRIKYVNSKNDLYQEDVYLVMRDGKELTQDSIIREVSATTVTTFDHVVKFARRLLAVETLRPKTTTIQVGNEGIYFTPYSKVLLQDDSLKIGLDHAIIKSVKSYSGLLRSITLDHAVAFPNKACGVVINAFNGTTGKMEVLKIKVDRTPIDRKNDVKNVQELMCLGNVKMTGTVPEPGNILSFGILDNNGEFSHICTEYMIASIKKNGNQFALELVNYNPALYDSGKIPPYSSSLSEQGSLPPAAIPKNVVSHFDLESEVARAVRNAQTIDTERIAQEAAQEAAWAITQGVHFSDVHRIEDIQYSIEEILQKIDDDAKKAEDSLLCSENDLYSTIQLTSSAITNIVAGAGAAASLQISLDLPALMNADDFVAFCQKIITAKINDEKGDEIPLTEAEQENRLRLINAVYARKDRDIMNYRNGKFTDFYTINPSSSSDDQKKLWDLAVKANAIASSIDMRASNIKMAAENVCFTNPKAPNDGETIVRGGYINTNTLNTNELFARQIVVYSPDEIEKDKKLREAFEKLSYEQQAEILANKSKATVLLQNAKKEKEAAKQAKASAEQAVTKTKIALSQAETEKEVIEAYAAAVIAKENAGENLQKSQTALQEAQRALQEAQTALTQAQKNAADVEANAEATEEEKQAAQQDLTDAEKKVQEAQTEAQEAQSNFEDAKNMAENGDSVIAGIVERSATLIALKKAQEQAQKAAAALLEAEKAKQAAQKTADDIAAKADATEEEKQAAQQDLTDAEKKVQKAQTEAQEAQTEAQEAKIAASIETAEKLLTQAQTAAQTAQKTFSAAVIRADTAATALAKAEQLTQLLSNTVPNCITMEESLYSKDNPQYKGSIRSSNYQPITIDDKTGAVAARETQSGAGWIIKQDGTAEFSNIKTVGMNANSALIGGDSTFMGTVNMGASNEIKLGNLYFSSQPSFIIAQVRLTPESSYHSGDTYTAAEVSGLIPQFSWVEFKGRHNNVTAVRIRANYDRKKIFRGLAGWRWRFWGEAWIEIQQNNGGWRSLGKFWAIGGEHTLDPIKDIPSHALYKVVKTSGCTVKMNLPSVCAAAGNHISTVWYGGYSKDKDGKFVRIPNYVCKSGNSLITI